MVLNPMKKCLGVLVFFLLVGAQAGAQETVYRAISPTVPVVQSNVLGEPFFQALGEKADRMPAGGVVAAEVSGRTVRFFKAGNPAPHKGIPPEKVIFEIGSITKIFTGLLLAQAVIEHKVSLDDPIGRYLPSSLALDPSTAAITLEQLATHTSGLPRMPDNFHFKDPLDPYADFTMDSFYSFLRNYHPKTLPPHPAEYSNVGVGLLGHVLELVYQQPYADLIVMKITAPLGLHDTVVNLNEEQKSRFAVPHSGPHVARALHMQAAEASGALHSTAADLVRFAQVLMLSEENPLRAAWDLAQQPRHDFVDGKIGLNVLFVERNDQIVYQHGGATTGFRSYLEWSQQPVPHVLVVMLNSDSLDPEMFVASFYMP
jgi:D-alanyl-D-alanine-carboxypeptidase/D-alanyl-D-alanine-endopeptidase